MDESITLDDWLLNLEDYISFSSSPHIIEKPEIADQVVRLLDRIQEVTRRPYAFIHIQQRALFGVCSPKPADYNPSNAVVSVVGRYDREFFVNLAARLRNP